MEDFKTIKSAMQKMVNNIDNSIYSDEKSNHKNNKSGMKLKNSTMKEKLLKQFKSSKKLFILALALALGFQTSITIAQENPYLKRQFKGGVYEETNETRKELNHYLSNDSNNDKAAMISDWIPNYFEKFGLADEGAAIEFGEFAEDSENNVIYTLTNGNQPFLMKAQTIKIDPAGNQLWMVEYNNYEHSTGNNIAIGSDDNIYISGAVMTDGLHHDLFIAKYASDGTFVWEQIISEDYFSTVESQTLVINDNIIYLIGSASNGINGHSQLVSAINTDGETQWIAQIPQNSVNDEALYSESYFNSSDELVILGNYFNSQDSEFYPYQVNIATDGTIMNQVSSNPLNKIKKFAYKNDIIYSWNFNGTALEIEKTDLDGSLIWSYNMATTSDGCYSYNLFVDENEDVYAFIMDGFQGNTLYCKLDSNGNEIFVNSYSPEAITNLFLFDISVNDSGEILMSGNGSDVVTYDQILTIVKFDNSGSFVSESLISPTSLKPFTFAYDYSYFNNKLYIGALQCGLIDGIYEQSRTLFVTAVDFDGQVLFNNFTAFENHSRTFVWGSDMDSESNMYHAANSAGKFVLIKQNPSGNIEWANEFWQSYEEVGCSDVLITDDNNILIGGYGWMGNGMNGLLVKTDMNGEELWSLDFMYEEFDTRIQNIKEDSEGNYLLASQYTDPFGYFDRNLLTKVSAEGQIIWQYLNPNPATNGAQLYFMDIASNNDIVFGGTEYNEDWYMDLFAERVASDGSLVWEYRANIGDNDLFSLVDCDSEGNTYLVVESSSSTNPGFGLIYKINHNGELDWEYEKANGYFYDVTINQVNEEHVYASGAFVSGTNHESNLIALSTSDGQEEWAFLQGEYSINEGLFIESDNQYIYQQTIAYDQLNEEHIVGLLAVDFEGNLIHKFNETALIGEGVYPRPIGIVQNNDKIGFSMHSEIPLTSNVVGLSGLLPKPDFVGISSSFDESLKIYPNPTENQLFVESELNDKIEIIDINGRIVFELFNSEYKSLIDVSNFSRGVYLIKVYTQDNIMTRKLIIE